MAEKEKLSFYGKINKIQTALYNIKKSGRNSYQGYVYKSFTDIKNAFNGLLDEYGIVFLPTNEHITVADMGLNIKENAKDYRIAYMQEYGLYDTASNDRQTFYFPMIAKHQESIDKANGSAVTYGLKYLFNLWGLIPDESLDPDTTEMSQGTKEKPQPKTKRVTDDPNFATSMQADNGFIAPQTVEPAKTPRKIDYKRVFDNLQSKNPPCLFTFEELTKMDETSLRAEIGLHNAGQCGKDDAN